MKDREFLIWLHDRLECVHNENPHKDYMHKLRAIIASIPEDKVTPNTLKCNNMEDLKELLDINIVRVPFEIT